MSDPQAHSLAGPILVGLGFAGLAIGFCVCRVTDLVTLISAGNAQTSPRWRERLWVHLFVSGGWSLSFGLVVMHGPPLEAWDVRLPGEATWPVWPWTEYVYLFGYLTPLVIAWIPRTRERLLRVAWTLVLLTAASTALFLLLPIAAPPRPFVASSLAGRLLTLETSRPDFAAASFPSFHALWAILLAQACSDRGGNFSRLAWAWAGLMSMACVANGAHALLDVVASWLLYGAIAFRSLPSWLRVSVPLESSRDFAATSGHSTDQKTYPCAEHESD